MRRIVCAFLLVFGSIDLIAFNFEEMERQFQDMHESMEQSFDRIRKQMYDAFPKSEDKSSWKVDYNDSPDGRSLLIAVMGVKTEKDPKAQLSDDSTHLTIVMDHGTVTLKAVKNWVSLSMKQSKEFQKKSKKGVKHATSISSKSTSRTVTQDLDLTQAKIDYSVKDSLLLLTIPYRIQAKRGRTIPVTISSGSSDSNVDDKNEDVVSINDNEVQDLEQ